MTDRFEAEGVTLICGDCMDFLPQRCDLVVTDPPYGTGCAPRGGIEAGSIDMDSTPNLDWDCFTTDWISAFSGIPMAVFCHPSTVPVLGLAMQSTGMLIYVKSNPSPFGTSIEACVTRGFSRKCPQHVVAYNAFNGQQHPTQKPLEVMEFVVGKGPAGVVLDPFMGSGTTGIACIRTGRKFIGIERDPTHFATAVARIQRELAQPRFDFAPKPVMEQPSML